MSDFDDWKKEYVRKGDLEKYAWIEYDSSLDDSIVEVVSFETIKALPAAKVIPVELHNDRMKVQERNRRMAELKYASIINSLYTLIDYFEDEAKELEELAVSNRNFQDGLQGQADGIRATNRFLIELVSGCESPVGFSHKTSPDGAYDIGISGHIRVPTDLSFDEFWDKFIGFVEENGWYFGGAMENKQ